MKTARRLIDTTHGLERVIFLRKGIRLSSQRFTLFYVDSRLKGRHAKVKELNEHARWKV